MDVASENHNQQLAKEEEIEIRTKEAILNVAKNMKNKGIEYELISQCTGLNLKEIEKL